MALVFIVGPPTGVFEEPHASHVRAAIESHFGTAIDLCADQEDSWYSKELGWSGWRTLQERAMEVLGDDAIPNLLSMEAWKGVYLPVPTGPGALADIPGDSTPLDVASLHGLVHELELLGRALNLPVDEAGLRELADRYLRDADLCDQDMDIQTYTQALMGAHRALETNQPLWVVK